MLKRFLSYYKPHKKIFILDNRIINVNSNNIIVCVRRPHMKFEKLNENKIRITGSIFQRGSSNFKEVIDYIKTNDTELKYIYSNIKK